MKKILLLLFPMFVIAQNNQEREFQKLMNTPAYVNVFHILKTNITEINKDSIKLTVNNKSNCNIIFRIKSTTETYKGFSLPVPARNSNSISLLKDEYLQTAVVCEKWFNQRVNYK